MAKEESKNKPKIEKHNEFRKVCLKNAEDLLRAAGILLQQNIDHVAFHLSALALEEIGKISLSAMKVIIEEQNENKEINLDLEDHEKKLFWAIWGPSFGREKITKKQIEERRGFAKRINERRKTYLYADPENPLYWREKMEEGEAKMLYDFANATFKIESAVEGLRTDMSEEETAELKWFFEATDNPDKRKNIFGNKSQEKLIEFGDVKKWIRWLREVYEEHEKEMQQLVQSELARQKPETKKEAQKPKWRIKIRIITPSHSVRNKHLTEFNKHSDFIKLYRVNTNTLILELTLLKAVPIHALWEHGWGIARMFVVALNIATRGFFWWNVPVDLAKYYEEIWDLEKNAGVGLELRPRLVLKWKELRWVLGTTELNLTSLTFSYINSLWTQKKTEALDIYVRGISLFAKNDIHLRLELNAFEQFYKALKKALEMNGNWDRKSDLKKALHEQLGWFYGENFANLDKMIDLATEVEATHQANKKVTITEVVAMKAYCDVYFLKLAKEYYENRTGRKLTLITEKLSNIEN